MKKPRTIQQWRDATEKDRREIPSHCFLSPSERTYPYKMWNGEEWVISKRMLTAAISRANSQNRADISRKAQRILHREFGD